jgi:hypothetical protein
MAIWRRAPGLQPGEALGQLHGVGDRRAGEQEAGRRAVGGGDAAQAAQDVGDVGAEDAAVDVRLVDHDDRQVGEEVRPRGVVGQDPDVEHVGVGEHEVRPPADGQALLAPGVSVVDRRAHQLRQPEGVQRARLVLRERLGGVQVERARLGVGAEHLERRQVEAQRLAARRPRGDDRRRLPRVAQCLRLMRVERVDPRVGQRLDDRRVEVLRNLAEDRCPRPLVGLAHETIVRTPGLQQGAPRLGAGGDGHPPHPRARSDTRGQPERTSTAL